MAWPRRGTRKLVVDGADYLWHFSGHCVLCSNAVVTVGQARHRYFLFVDPWPHGWELRPATLADAVRWAVAASWSPKSGPTRAMAYDDNAHRYVWLADGQRHLYETGG